MLPLRLSFAAKEFSAYPQSKFGSLASEPQSDLLAGRIFANYSGKIIKANDLVRTWETRDLPSVGTESREPGAHHSLWWLVGTLKELRKGTRPTI